MDVAALKQAFAAFDSDDDGAVTVELLQRLFATLGLPAPSDDELAAFIQAVEAERHTSTAELSTLPPLRGVEVGEPASPGETSRRRHYSSPDLLRTDTHTSRAPHQQHSSTMWEVFASSAQRFPDNPMLGSRATPTGPYEWRSYREVYERVCALGRAFADLGLAAGDLVGVMLPTCAEWTVSQLALWSQSLTTVTLYETYGPDAISFILKQAELSIVITIGSKVQQLIDLAGASHLKIIVSLGPATVTNNPNNVRVVQLVELEQQGAASSTPLRPPSADDRLFIIYTSGTTGDPKGVVHSHSALLANVGAALRNLPLQPDEVHFAFLPMAHIMEQFIEALVIAVGGAIGYWTQNIRALSDDIQALRPTMFIGVPRVLNRYFDTIKANFDAAQGPKRLLIDWALESKRRSLAKGRFLSYWDLFVFRQVARQALGGRVRFIATGSAPISPELLELFRLCFSCCIVEGYGMTEVLVVSGTPHIDTSKRSHVGAPWDAVEIKLVDVPDMNYLSTDQPYPRGEICFRGPLVMREYFRDPVRTAEALDADGWLHSGDIGCWLEDGHLRILDRKKNIFKLSNGEYVQPEKLEQLYVQSKYVAQIFVDGSPLEAQLVAVIVPDPTYVPELAAIAELPPTDVAAVLASDAVRRAIIKDLDAVAANHKLNAYERIAAVHLAAAEFPPDLLTPTFKLKRNVARQFYQDQVAALYAALNASA